MKKSCNVIHLDNPPIDDDIDDIDDNYNKRLKKRERSREILLSYLGELNSE